jgi:hypothetical protein
MRKIARCRAGVCRLKGVRRKVNGGFDLYVARREAGA